MLPNLLPADSGDSLRPMASDVLAAHRQEGGGKGSLSPRGIRVLCDGGPGRAQGVGRAQDACRRAGLGEEGWSAWQASRLRAAGLGRSGGLGTRVALGAGPTWRGRARLGPSCPGWWGCGPEARAVPALETEDPPAPCP